MRGNQLRLERGGFMIGSEVCGGCVGVTHEKILNNQLCQSFE